MTAPRHAVPASSRDLDRWRGPVVIILAQPRTETHELDDCRQTSMVEAPARGRGAVSPGVEPSARSVGAPGRARGVGRGGDRWSA